MKLEYLRGVKCTARVGYIAETGTPITVEGMFTGLDNGENDYGVIFYDDLSHILRRSYQVEEIKLRGIL
jgi:hypothetical protein